MNANIDGTTPNPPPSAPRLGRWAGFIAVLVAIALVAGLIPRWRHRGVLRQQTRSLATPTVHILYAVPGTAMAALTLSAEVRPALEAPIYARASGFIKRRHVDIGDRVEPGQLLVDIDTPELDQELASSRAGLARAQAALTLAKTTSARWAELLKTSSVSEQEAAEKQADLALKEADVAGAEATMHRCENLLSFAHVTAPFAGRVTSRNIDMGDLISSGKELFRLADTRTLRVFVRVPQPASLNVITGEVATLTVPELPTRKFAARVVRTAGVIDPISRTLLAELEVDNSANDLLAGSYAQVTFADRQDHPALVLPSTTLLFRAEGVQVGVVGSGDRVELRHIVIGRDLGKTVEVVSGIDARDRVIVNPSDSLESGITVRVAQTEKVE